MKKRIRTSEYQVMDIREPEYQGSVFSQIYSIVLGGFGEMSYKTLVT